ncbi:MAG: SH3 domain-containing protein [Promethearchaeota archaeon]|jgi:hypothetical protein
MIHKKCKVIAEYNSSFPEPLIIQKGEELKVVDRHSEWPGWIWCINRNNQEGWVPRNYIKLRNDVCIALQDYDATELSVSIDDELIIEYQESGWIWVTNKEGNKGWVPLQNVEIIK